MEWAWDQPGEQQATILKRDGDSGHRSGSHGRSEGGKSGHRSGSHGPSEGGKSGHRSGSHGRSAGG
ncbi:hypothetical protein [Cohnella caldifontis]|uniref:hypothetical protein n=1 Tax=Cohnella caldifontis TaxID=3027471 RepID=UPI0023ED3355|nr:hypothetical protein [Cohnella sp. YIM B05605]